MHPAGKGGVKTLCQTLPDGDPLRDDRVAHMVGENLEERVVTLKLKVRKYPAIHTNYIYIPLHHFTI